MKQLCLLILISLSVNLYGQELPSFSAYKGKAYAVPKDSLYMEYRDSYLDHYVLDEFVWKDIHFEEREGNYLFGDLWWDNATWALHLTSTMTISERSCYQFSLTTDDGSYLWIDGNQIIDNSGDHRMTNKKQNVLLDTGTYDVKIWYYQLHHLCGFIFDAINLNRVTDCGDQESKIKETFTLNGSVIFESGSSVLKETAKNSLDAMLANFDPTQDTKIKIYGHTDNVGEPEDNMALSLARAESIRKYMEEKYESLLLNIKTVGLGESQPISDNKTKEGRARNRRVVIDVH